MTLFQRLRGEWSVQLGIGLNVSLVIWFSTVGFVLPLFANGGGGGASPLNPDWWSDREVIDINRDVQNEGIVNLGQLKWISTQFKKELDLLLPLGTSIYGEGANLPGALFVEAMKPTESGYSAWSLKNKMVANVGQGKNVAKPFYSLLNAISPTWVRDQLVESGLPIGTIDTAYKHSGVYYPWTVSTSDDRNKAVMTIGQLKTMFSLRVRADTDLDANGVEEGLPDLFELALAKLTNADYSNYIDVPNSTNPFFGKSINEITLKAGSLDLIVYQGGSWNNTPVKAPFPGLAEANASVSSLLNEHQPIGSVGGSFSVGGDGSASYTIPIDIPKGTAGMEPQIAIGYNSNGGNGALGVGFDISGFQRITRGPTSRAREGGGLDPVNFNANDRFYFDGELLVAINGGTYGAHRTEYRTENDSFARIISWGILGSGPAFWTVETKAGLRIELGNCDTSCVEAPLNKGAVVWNVNKVSDNIGNYYEVRYQKEVGAGPLDFRLDSVCYSGFDSEVPSLRKLPYCKVNFIWGPRFDVTTGVIHGVKVSNNKRLTEIQVGSLTDNTFSLLHKYAMNYADASESVRRSRLIGIQKFNSDNESLPPTLFTWTVDNSTEVVQDPQNPAPMTAERRQRWVSSENTDYNRPGWSKVGLKTQEYVEFLDMNGDGLPDRVTGVAPSGENKLDYTTTGRSLADYGVWVSLNSGNGFKAATKWFDPSVATAYEWTTGGGSGGKMQKWIKKRLSTPTFESLIGFYDINGDSLPDRVQSYDFSSTNGFPSNSLNSYSPTIDANGDLKVGGNEKYLSWVMDLRTQSRGIMVALNTGNGFEPVMKKWLGGLEGGNQHQLLADDTSGNVFSAFIDMNSDGIPDRVDHYDYGSLTNGLYVALGKGYFDSSSSPQSGFHPKQKWYSSTKIEQNRVTWAGSSGDIVYSTLLDINGDGFLDKIDHVNGTGTNDQFMWVSRGRGFYDGSHSFPGGFHEKEIWYTSSSKQEQTYPTWNKNSYFLDVNGDGLPDRVDHADYTSSSSGVPGIWVSLNKGKSTSSSGFETRVKWLAIASTVDSQGSRIDTISNGTKQTKAGFQDMNGDGLPDRVQYFASGSGGKGIYVALNKGLYESGSGFESFQFWFSALSPLPESHNYLTVEDVEGQIEVTLMDMNADGLPDRVSTREPSGSNSPSGIWVALNKGKHEGGNGFFPARNWLKRAYRSSTYSEQIFPVWRNQSEVSSTFMDINGDGFPDRVDHYNDSPTFTGTEADRKGLWVSLNFGGGFDGDEIDYGGQFAPKVVTSELIHSITDGLGATIKVEFKRLNDARPRPGDSYREFYTREIPSSAEFAAESAARIIRAPGTNWAVSRYAEEDGLGLGGMRWVRQYYGGRKVDANNEVDLGFRWVETFDEARSQGSISIFHQQFPFQGNVKESVSYLKNNGNYIVLSRETMDYRLVDYPYIGGSLETSSDVPILGWTGMGSSVNGGKIKFTHLKKSRSEEYAFDTLAGALAPVTLVTAASGVGPSRTFVGRLLSNSEIISQTYSEWGDLTQSISSSAGETTTLDNVFPPASLVTTPPAIPYDLTSGNPGYQTIPVSGSKLFGKWILGRLSSGVSVTSKPGFPNLTKTSSFTYYGVEDSLRQGMLKTETSESGNPNALVTQTSYDARGNVSEVQSYPQSSPTTARFTQTTYDTEGRFPISVTDTLGYIATSVYDSHRALLLSSTSANGFTTRFFYDSYGTRILTRNADGTETAEITANAPASVAGVSGIVHKRVVQTSGSPRATAYVDKQGRTVLTETTAFGGAKVYVQTKYDALGREEFSTLPKFGSVSTFKTSATYDAAGRVCETTNPDQSKSKVWHNGFESKLQNALNQTQFRTLDHKGRVIQTKDSLSQVTTFAYDLAGNLVSTISPEGTITATFDILGNRLSVTDSDSGTETTTYNAFGQPLVTTDAANNSVSFTYDSAGRVQYKYTRLNGALESTTQTFYENSPGASLGNVKSTTMTWHTGSNLQQGGSLVNTSYSFDYLGRTIATTESRNLFDRKSQTFQTETFTSSMTYDDLGRAETETNAGGLTVRNTYDANGFHTGIFDYYTGTAYWQPLNYDAGGRLLTELLGNGVTNTKTYKEENGTLLTTVSKNTSNTVLQNLSFVWDVVGNLTSRKDNRKNLTETFGYDSLNRLTTSTVGTKINTVTYSSGGNILTRSDRGTYTYHGTKKHQMTALTSTTLGNRTYQYDANGSLVLETKAGANNRVVKWGGHGKVSSAWQADTHKVDGLDGTSLYAKNYSNIVFYYDSGINRIRKTMERNTASALTYANIQNIVTTDYFGSYERIRHEVRNGASIQLQKIEHRHYIAGIAVKTFTNAPGVADTEKTVYQLQDHLGSTTAVTSASGVILIENGKEQVYSYDSWGQRRDAATWLAYSDSGGTMRKSRETDRGYTGHEMLDEVGLVHMNGRIYDSEIGRFLSADPFVQAPENSQNYNRYAYVLNNPLSYTDPSGHFFKGLFKGIGKFFKNVGNAIAKVGKWVKENWRTVLSIAVAALAAYAFVGLASVSGSGTLFGTVVGGPGGALGSAWASGAAAGAIAGGFNAAINGGSIGDILKGALIGGIQGGITAGYLHNQQGQFFEHVVGHGIVGGAANEAMGGKFADGFIGAAAGAGAGYLPYVGAYLDPGNANTNLVSRTALAATIGGTVASVSGGKFANGAYTAAFQHLLNQEVGRASSEAYRKRVLGKRAKIVSRIQAEIASGTTKANISKSEVRAIMLGDLIDARDFAASGGKMSFIDFYRTSGTLDGTFHRFAGVEFNVGGDYPLSGVPGGIFSAGDINYAYYGMVSENLYPYRGGIISEAANTIWNVGEQFIGNDMAWSNRANWHSSGVSYQNGIGQIGRARKWADYGVHLQRHSMAK